MTDVRQTALVKLTRRMRESGHIGPGDIVIDVAMPALGPVVCYADQRTVTDKLPVPDGIIFPEE
jgi:hypothetical protein